MENNQNGRVKKESVDWQEGRKILSDLVALGSQEVEKMERRSI
jgi:hypothetical protein